MLNRIINKVRTLRVQYGLRQQVKKLPISRDRKNIFLVQTPTHSNIGDHAIAVAQLEFLQQHAAEWNLVEVNQTILEAFIPYYKSKMSTEDIIILIGGGNFGNQYMREENLRRNVINSFPDNKIISFPQTIYYTDDATGLKELKKTQAIIDRHKNITIVAREQVSFELVRRYFPNAKIILTPDIVLSMDRSASAIEREGILLVLRGDAEKILTDEITARLKDFAGSNFDKVTESDMHHHSWITNTDDRALVLQNKFEQFRSAELVITDRLHGMVFAAITGTPCIAFSNYNQKVSGTYEWIKELEYIKFVPVDANIEEIARDLLAMEGSHRYVVDKLNKYYKNLSSTIHE